MVELTAERLREVVEYDLERGLWKWKNQKWKREHDWFSGQRDKDGYYLISLDCERFPAHRLAHLYVEGTWPSDSIDHKNGNRADNRWTNLRPATKAENSRNKITSNKHGFKGVSKIKKRFHARIQVDYERINIGVFDTPEEAHAAYCAAAIRYHGEFARF